MKILFVYGDDYAALNAEEYGLQKAYEKAKEHDGKYRVLNPDDPAFVDAYVEILEFGEVDSKFIDFLRDDMIDYDDSKHTNFYEITEEGRVI